MFLIQSFSQMRLKKGRNFFTSSSEKLSKEMTIHLTLTTVFDVKRTLNLWITSVIRLNRGNLGPLGELKNPVDPSLENITMSPFFF